MKRIIKEIIIGVLIFSCFLLLILKFASENDARNDFKVAFGFSPSGINYGLWTGIPDSAMAEKIRPRAFCFFQMKCRT